MAKNRVLNALGKAPGLDNTIELFDADGNTYELRADSGQGGVVFEKNGTQQSLLYGNKLGLGAPAVVTIASGVATVTSSFVQLAAESSTSDQLDTITMAGVGAGDLLLLTADTGDTITVDDANIDLGAGTRVLVGPNQFLLLVYNGSSWSEVSFAAGDNV